MPTYQNKTNAKHRAIDVISEGIKQAHKQGYYKPYDLAVFAVVALVDEGIGFRYLPKKENNNVDNS